MTTTALIKFGSYTFNTSRDIKTADEEGDSVIPVTAIAKKHGVTVNSTVVLNAKIIRMTGRIKAATIDLFKAAWYALTAAINTGIGTEVPVPQKLYLYSCWFNYAYKQRFSSSHIKGSGGKAKYYNIEFLCTDPFDYFDATGLSLAGYNNTDGQREVSLNVGENTGWIHTNNGDATQYPVITLTAVQNMASGFIIGNTTTGETIQINIALTAGDVLIIDCGNGTVTLNGSDVLVSLVGTVNMALVAGDNSMTWTRGSFSGAGTLKIKYYDRYYP